MLGSGDGARSTLNSPSKPGTQNKTTQKPGARTAHERNKKRNTTKRKTGPRQRQGRKLDTSFPVYILGGSGSWVGALSLWLGFGVGALWGESQA